MNSLEDFNPFVLQKCSFLVQSQAKLPVLVSSQSSLKFLGVRYQVSVSVSLDLKTWYGIGSINRTETGLGIGPIQCPGLRPVSVSVLFNVYCQWLRLVGYPGPRLVSVHLKTEFLLTSSKSQNLYKNYAAHQNIRSK